MSNRKPYNQNLGYVASRRHYAHKGYIVIYDNRDGQLELDTDHRWVIVCETHNTLTSMPSLPKAREVMKCADFCEECMQYVYDHEITLDY